MVHRPQEDGIITISQPAHAWLSGELARAWGNEAFGSFEPAHDVCMAAALHDIGFLNWERLPTRSPDTGLPHTFLDLPTPLHLELWSRSIRQMLHFSRYAALLVSMHFTHLCRTHRSPQPSNAACEGQFLRDQEVFERTLLTSLRNDFHYAPFSADETVARNRELLSHWDWLSLMLCFGVRDQRHIADVPAAHGRIEIALAAVHGDPARVVVSPWPFRLPSVRLLMEGRHLSKTFSSQTAMRRAYRAASPVTLKMRLFQSEAEALSADNLDV